MPNLRVFYQKDANGTANSEDPDQTAPLGAVRSGSAQFAQTCLSENLGSLWYAWFNGVDMSCVIRKLVFKVPEQVRHKPGCTDTKNG